MKKIIFTLLVFCMISVFFYANALEKRQYTADETNFKIVINGVDTTFLKPVLAVEDRSYLPIRDFCEAVGYDVEWDSERDTIHINKRDDFIQDDLYTSREGTLERGKTYFFHGANSKYSLEDNYSDLKYIRDYDYKFTSRTVVDIANELEEMYGDVDNTENYCYVISYDAKNDCLIFYHEPPEDRPVSGGKSIFVVNCKDGTVSCYAAGTK